MKCESCKNYIKPTIVDLVLLDLVRSSSNKNQQDIDKLLKKLCKAEIIVNKKGCVLYKKKWWMFWIKG